MIRHEWESPSFSLVASKKLLFDRKLTLEIYSAAFLGLHAKCLKHSYSSFT